MDEREIVIQQLQAYMIACDLDHVDEDSLVLKRATVRKIIDMLRELQKDDAIGRALDLVDELKSLVAVYRDDLK